MATLKDIAKEAGVSVMTVSRVINGHRSKVSEENMRRIEEIIKRRGYVPNLSARSLSSNHSHIIAVILPGKGSSLENPYNAVMAGDIIECAQDRGYYVMVHFTEDYEDITHRLHTWNVDGAIFLGTFDRNIQRIQERNRIPLVFTDSYTPLRQISNIGLDDYRGGMLAARHFIERGHRGFAFVGTSLKSSGVVKHRLQGFRDTLEQAGLTLRPEYVIDAEETPHPEEILCRAGKEVTAILASADMLAVTLIDALRAKGCRVPQDYSLIGFDNLPISRYITPKLTTIGQDIGKKAELAGEMLFRHIQDPEAPAENVFLDVQLIERQSVCNLCRDDIVVSDH